MLPPGPRTPAAAQTIEWVARPTALLRRCAARYGDPFTLRTAWAEAPMALTWDPEAARRVFAADPAVLRGGQGAAFLEPFTGPRSILLLDGPEHLRQRRLMLPPFHGERLAGQREAIAELAAAEVARWPPGRPLATLPRMQALTLEVIVRLVFGVREGDELDALRVAIRRAMDLTTTLPRLVAMTLVRRELGPHSPWAAFRRAVAELDALLHAIIRRRDPEPGSILATLLEARHEDGSAPSDALLRDQLVTLLAAGHETTSGALAWALERLARHPHVLARAREGDDAYLDAIVKEVLRVRPVLSIVSRTTAAPYRLGDWELPPGVHVAVCIYLAHRNPAVYPDPTAFRPERWLEDDAPEGIVWVPFGGGRRRCVGAAFASMEMREVLRAVAAAVTLEPDRPEGERARRRSITLTPARGGRIVPHTLDSDPSRCRCSAVTTA